MFDRDGECFWDVLRQLGRYHARFGVYLEVGLVALNDLIRAQYSDVLPVGHLELTVQGCWSCASY